MAREIPAVTLNPQEFHRVVLEAVSDDYQPFESVVSRLSRTHQGALGVVEVERILLTSIASKLVAAYLLHADPPYATEVGPDMANIRTFWFCITEQGLQHLGRQA